MFKPTGCAPALTRLGRIEDTVHRGKPSPGVQGDTLARRWT